MPTKYDENIKAKAVRLVREHADAYDSEWAGCAISARLGMTAETLRKWVRQAEVDAGEAAGVPTETARELRELRRKNRELEQTIEILQGRNDLYRRPTRSGARSRPDPVRWCAARGERASPRASRCAA